MKQEEKRDAKSRPSTPLSQSIPSPPPLFVLSIYIYSFPGGIFISMSVPHRLYRLKSCFHRHEHRSLRRGATGIFVYEDHVRLP